MQALQVGAQVRGRLVAHGAIFFQRLIDDALELLRHIGVDAHRRNGRAIQDGVENRRGRRARESLAAGSHFVEHHAKRKNICARIKVFAQSLFRRHVGNRADGNARAGEIGVIERGGARSGVALAARCDHHFGQSEIENFGLAAVGEKNIRGLDVAMNDAFRMRGVESVSGLDAGFEQGIEPDGPAGDAMLQRRALQQFHGDVTAALIFADFKDGANIGMAEGGGGTCFAQETVQRQLVLRNFVRQKFQRHHAAQLGVFGLVHHAHAAATQPFYDAIL